MRQQSQQKENEVKFGINSVRVYPTDEQKVYLRDWLAVRQWACPFCHAQHDRDVNASRNILKRALA